MLGECHPDCPQAGLQAVSYTHLDPDIAPRTVFFNIGSAEVSPREAMNLSYLADQMKQFPNATYVDAPRVSLRGAFLGLFAFLVGVDAQCGGEYAQ